MFQTIVIKFLRNDYFRLFFLASIPACLFLPAGFISVSVISLLVFCLGAAVVERISFFDNIKQQWLLTLPLALYAVYCVWIIFSDVPANGVTEVVKKAPMVMIPLAFVLMNRKFLEIALQLISGTFLIGCILVSLLCYGKAILNIYEFQTIVYELSDHRDYYFMYFPLTEVSGILPIYLGMYCNLAFMIALTTKLLKRNRDRYLVAGYVAVFIILIASKIGIICLILTTCIFIITKIRRRVTIYVLTACAVAFLLLFNIPYFKERFSVATSFDYAEPNSGLWTSTTFRIAIWSCAFETIGREPLLGYGTTDGQVALYKMYEEKNFARGLYDFYNTHNEFLGTMLDLGVTGVIFLTAMFVFPGIRALREMDAMSLVFLTIALCTFFIENVLMRQRGIVFFIYFYCLFISNMNPRPGTDARA